jgi:hypothetical protein
VCIVVHFTFSRWRILNQLHYYFLSGRNLKVHIFRHLFVCFQTSVYTLGEFWWVGGVNFWIWRSQIPFYWRRKSKLVKQIFATVKSTIDTDNSSNTVLLFLFLWNSPNVYTLVWKHTNRWRNICTFQIPSAKRIVM